MKLRTEGYSHFKAIEIGGESTEVGTGLQLTPGVGTQPPAITMVGDAMTPQSKFIGSAATKTIVDGSPTNLFEVAIPVGEMVGGSGTFLVRASDGTEFQADAGIFTFSGVNKAGTVTGAVTYVAANEAKTVTGASTLTLAFTVLAGTGKMTIRVQPTGSLALDR